MSCVSDSRTVGQLGVGDVSKEIHGKYNMTLNNQTILNWLECYKEYLPFLRMRDFILKKYDKKEAFETVHMFHSQIYDFKYHRAKLETILDESFKHYKFRPLKEFLELVVAECPHQVFKEGKLRASEYKDIFNLDQVMNDKDKETKDVFIKILKDYQIQRRKILNLKNAWARVFGGDIKRGYYKDKKEECIGYHLSANR